MSYLTFVQDNSNFERNYLRSGPGARLRRVRRNSGELPGQYVNVTLTSQVCAQILVSTSQTTLVICVNFVGLQRCRWGPTIKG